MKQGPVIHLAPAHPCMGWVSMNRYWQALLNESTGDPEVVSLVRPVAVESPSQPRWHRQWIRRIVYPLRVRSCVKSGVLHVLDHSFADLLAHVKPGVRTVVTVHDLIPLTDPADLTATQRARFEKTVSWISHADKVVRVSQHTRTEVQRLLQVQDEKLHVLPNGTSCLPAADERMSRRLTVLPPFILSVGGTRPRKNLELLVPLAEHLAALGTTITMVRIGPPLNESLAAGIRRHATLLELGSVSDAELAAAYSHAALTLIPSFHEGFGLPVLEAMQAGCPVVHSLATSLPEVAGDAGLGFAPSDAALAAVHCQRILSDPGLRDRLISAGHERASRFTWNAHWQGLRAIYTALLNP